MVSDGTFYYTGGGYDGTNVHSDVFKYDPVANTFTPLASAPDQFFLSQAVIFNNKIYSIAGFNLGGQSTTTRIYDIAGNSWTTGTAIPEAQWLVRCRYGVGQCEWEDIYCMRLQWLRSNKHAAYL